MFTVIFFCFLLCCIDKYCNKFLSYCHYTLFYQISKLTDPLDKQTVCHNSYIAL